MCYQWRLNPILLSDFNFISSEITLFLETNSTPGMSCSTIWESLKAYLHGQIISYTVNQNRVRPQRLRDLSESIATLDEKYATDPSSDLHKEHQLLQSEFDELSTRQAEQLLLRARYRVYEQGDKASKLLAHQIHKSEASRLIPQIRTPSGATTVIHKENNDQFKQFYSALYMLSETRKCFNSRGNPKLFNEAPFQSYFKQSIL